MRGAGLAALVACAIGTPRAWAQSGFMQVQYERAEAQSLVQLNDSTLVPVTTVLSYWTQNYQMNKALAPNPNTSITWQLGFQDRQAVDRLERSQIPYGNLRLTLPVFGMYASVRPVTNTTTSQNGLLAGAPIGGVPTTTTRQRSTQSMFTAYLADPRLPRVDLSWVRDQRDQAGPSGDRFSDRRDLRASQTFGVFNVRANYGDLARGREAFKTSPYQRNLGTGAGVDLRPRPGMDVKLDYDFARFDRRAVAGYRSESQTHRLNLNGNWAQSRTLAWTLYSWYQHSAVQRTSNGQQDNAEAQAFGAWTPSRTTRFQTGVQLRREVLGTRSGLERIWLATGAWNGTVRPGWTGALDLTQSVTWSRFRSLFGNTTGHVGSRTTLHEGIALSFDVQGTVSNDSLRDSRAIGQGSAALLLTPLRALQVNLHGSAYRVGPSFRRVQTSTRSGDVDLRWTPWQSLQFSGNVRGQTSGPVVKSHSVTQAAYVRWIPGTMVQLNVNYSKTRFDDSRSVVSNGILRGREMASVQGAWSLDRMKQINAEFGVLDPNSSRRTNTYNASFTWRFGR